MFRALAIRSRRPQFSTKINARSSRWFQNSCLLRREDIPADLPDETPSLQLPRTDIQFASAKQTTQVPEGSPKVSLKAGRTTKPRKNTALSEDLNATPSNAATVATTEEQLDGTSKRKRKRSSTPKVKNRLPVFGPQNQPGRPTKKKQERPAQQVLNPQILVPQTRQKYIRKLLQDVTGKSKWTAMDRKRVNIVNEYLCDDILERLGPSLQKYKGCDIIDINPGVGVWSTKLHDYLQPRSHILMEPCHEAYKSLLDPLLAAPGSKFQLVPKSGIIWNHLETILSKKHLPFQEVLNPADPRLELPNTTLLVTANIASFPKQPYRRFNSIANLIIHQFLAASRTHSLFHRYGKIRMLIWFDDDDLKNVVPRSLGTRKRSAIEAELSCKHIETVVSSISTSTERLRRETSIDLESVRRVRENMLEKGILTPDGRESHLMEELSHEESSQKASAYEPRFMDELAELERRYAAGEFQREAKVEIVAERNGKLGRPRAGNLTAEWQRMKYLQKRFTTQERRRDFVTELVDEWDSIMALQREHFTLNSQDEKNQLFPKLQKRIENWKNAVAKAPGDAQDSAIYGCDQRHAFQQSPPALFWDRREAEPLKANGDRTRDRGEFHPPAANLALVDFQPGALPSAITNNLTENYDVLDYIIQKLVANPSQTVHETLKTLWPGGYEWLLADCPDLTDPTKGGSYDLEFIRTRSFSSSMIMKIVESWLRWPYRPTRIQLLRSLGAEAWESDQEDD